MAEVDDQKEQGMTLGDHLDELRSRLFRGVVVTLVCFVTAYIYRIEVTQIVMGPFEKGVGMLNGHWELYFDEIVSEDASIARTEYFVSDDPEDMRLIPKLAISDIPMMTGTSEGFMMKLRASLYFALFVGGPYLLWQLWGFISAGLYKTERRVVLSFFPASILLFFSGVLFGYYMLVPYGIYYLNIDEVPGVALLQFRLEEYFAFVTSMCLALGVVFQLPILQTAVAKVGLVRPSTFAHYRGHFALSSFIIAALLTPPDPVTQSMMAAPMVLLYELGILSSRLVAPKTIELDLDEA
jgi:sec-independent protein translocase protein TatC